MNEENLVFINPKQNRFASIQKRKQIRSSFSKSKRNAKGFSLALYIGTDIAKQVGLDLGDHVSLCFDKNNERNIFIKKAKTGFSLSKVSIKTPPSYRIMLEWVSFTPKATDLHLQVREYEIINENKILVKF